MKKLFFLILLLETSIALATKPCTNEELCPTVYGEIKTNSAKCRKMADIIVVAEVKNFKADPPGYVPQSFDLSVSKTEKGKLQDLKSLHFQTGCWEDEDLSALLGGVKIDHGPKYRIYLVKSAKEKSGYKIIQYELLK